MQTDKLDAAVLLLKECNDVLLWSFLEPFVMKYETASFTMQAGFLPKTYQY